MTRPATDDAILDLWAEGLTAAGVAAELGLRTRSIVLGVVQRARRRGDRRAALRMPSRRNSRAARLAMTVCPRASVIHLLRAEAATREVEPEDLAAAILSAVLTSGLVPAVLDEATR